jgi:hypothetical protein
LHQGVQKLCFCICCESTAFTLHWPTKNLSFLPAQSFFFDLKPDLIIGADKKQDSSVAVVSINMLGNIFFRTTKLDTGLRRSTVKSRRLTHELSPPVIYHGTLSSAMEWLSVQMNEHFRLHVHSGSRGSK